MRIALAQINTTIGALAENAAKIIAWIERAREQGAELVIFPELTLTGYPPMDLLQMPHFVEAQLAELEAITAQTFGMTVILGCVQPNPESSGRELYNSAVVLSNGRFLSQHHKRLIPTYDVFDEARYFEPGRGYNAEEICGARAGVTICEDIWNDKDYWIKRRYEEDPVETFAARGVKMIHNISGSPFHIGKPAQRLEMLQKIASKHNVWLTYCNLVGGNDQLIFDGRSAVIAPDGSVRGLAKAFEENLLVVDTEAVAEVPSFALPSMEQDAHDALVLGIRDYVGKCGFGNVLIGLSGGVDSALTCALAVEALGADKVRGIAMPSPYSSGHSVEDAFALAANLGIRIDKVEIAPMYEAYRKQLAPLVKREGPDDITVMEENLQARIRGATLMALSNETGALVLSTGNKSETAVGYSTLYGDMCGGLSAIGDAPKTLVYRICHWINRDKEKIPERTITKPPSAELRPGQLDEDSLPAYDRLDPIIQGYVEDNKSIETMVSEGHDEATVRRVVRMIDLNEYKRRQAAPILRITHRAFGTGRQIPIAQRYRQT